MPDLLVLAIIGAGTYALRAAFLVSGRSEPPRPVVRTLPFVGPAVLAALTVPALVAPSGTISLAGSAPAVLAAAAAWLVWRRRASLPLALFGGLVCGWIATAVAGAVASAS